MKRFKILKRYKPRMIDMSNTEYRAARGLSNSDLKYLQGAPADLICAENTPKDVLNNKTGVFGNLFHCLALEPKKFASRYIFMPKFDLRKPADKLKKIRFELNNKKTIITDADYKKAQLMVRSLKAHPEWKKYMKMNREFYGLFEQSIFWKDKQTGIVCKCRPDMICGNGGTNGFVIDLKSIDKIDKWLPNNIQDYGYHLQAYHYMQGVNSYYGPSNTRFIFAFVSKTPLFGKHQVKFVELGVNAMEQAKNAHHYCLRVLKNCIESKVWDGIEEIDFD